MTPPTAAPLADRRAPAAADAFRCDVLRGLRRGRKALPCKYFYDARGSQLFEQICELEEYYPTRCELEILERRVGAMADAAGRGCVLIEYGSGSSRKTRRLLDCLHAPAAYVPVDISGEHLAHSAGRLTRRYPSLRVAPVCADFTRPFELPAAARSGGRRVLYFSGSTIGNFRPREAVRLLAGMARLVGPGGGLLIAADLKKDPAVLEPAYDDRMGVTAAFNLNLLARINRELGADFALDRFRHHAFYNARRGRVEMHLVSREDQSVRIGDEVVTFAAGESVRTEYSYKYSPADFRAVAARAGLRVEHVWTDARGWFSVQWLAEKTFSPLPSGERGRG
jgi:dimethylhistidine N-methyltransferase